MGPDQEEKVKPENLMLLGFMNKALAYLEENQGNDTDPVLTKLESIDIDKLKNELNGDLNASYNNVNSTIESLLNAGGEVFDDFISRDKTRKSISDQLSRILDVDLDPDRSVKNNTGHSQETLKKLYDLKNDILGAEIKRDKTSKTEQKRTNTEDDLFSNDSYETAEDETPDKSDSYLGLYNPQRTQEEAEESLRQSKARADLSKYDGPLVQRDDGRQVVTSFRHDKDETVLRKQDIQKKSVPVGMTDIGKKTVEESVNDVIQNIVNPGGEPDLQASAEEETPFEMSEEDDRLLQMIAQNVSGVQSEETGGGTGQHKELDSIFSEVLAHEEGDMNSLVTDLAPDQVDPNDIVRLVKEIQSNRDTYYSQINEKTVVASPGDILNPPDDHDDDDDEGPGTNLDLMLDDLREKMVSEDEIRKAHDEEFNDIYDSVRKSYPYLRKTFIRAIYELKDQIASDYPQDVKIIILHRVVFKDVDKLRQFVEIALNHGYNLNADEDKLIVDVFKEYMNSDGKIITAILDVANQGALLGGDYDGYRVLLIENQ